MKWNKNAQKQREKKSDPGVRNYTVSLRAVLCFVIIQSDEVYFKTDPYILTHTHTHTHTHTDEETQAKAQTLFDG